MRSLIPTIDLNSYTPSTDIHTYTTVQDWYVRHRVGIQQASLPITILGWLATKITKKDSQRHLTITSIIH